MNDLLRRADEIPVTLVVLIAFVTMAFVMAWSLEKSNEPSRNCTCMVKPPALPIP